MNQQDMNYNLAYKESKIKAFKKLTEYSEKGLIIKLDYVKNTRSDLQNRALHLYFENIANALNEIGYYYHYNDPFSDIIIEIQWTKELVKEYIWRKLQQTMFNIESTTKLTTEMINTILESISLWLSEKGISIIFPNRYDLLLEKLKEHEQFLS